MTKAEAGIETVKPRLRRIFRCAWIVGGLGIAASVVSLAADAMPRDALATQPDPSGYMMFLLYGLLTIPYVLVGAFLALAGEPGADDDVYAWHRALDLAVGVLVGAPIVIAGAVMLPNSTRLAEVVEGQLFSLAAVGSVFTAIVPLRSALHEATGHRRRRPRQDADPGA